MQGYSPKLPLLKDSVDGCYGLNKTLVDTIKQNFKMLILTDPGERIMMPDFGVGIRRFLFDQDTDSVRASITTRIRQQVSQYMSFLTIDDISISSPESNDENTVFIQIKYSITNLNVKDILNIEV